VAGAAHALIPAVCFFTLEPLNARFSR